MKEFLDKAEALMPPIFHKPVYPACIVHPVRDDDFFQGWRMEELEPAAALEEKVFARQESIILDFGDHLVGYLSLDIRAIAACQDAPLKIRFTFGELPFELVESFDLYKGWLSSSWLQEELVFVDVLPTTLRLPRRYSFRYLKIEILDTSPSYSVRLENIICDTVTSADLSKVSAVDSDNAGLRQMDQAGVLTLKDCMQTVFEDGPKRDRRLWIGDLRLQALVNYHSFRNYDLVRRCLYLFAGLADEKGRIPSCLYENPKPAADNIHLYDYCLFFTSALSDYLDYSGDRRTAAELWPTAFRQVEVAMARLDERHIIQDDDTWWSFVDWTEGLNKQAPTQGILIYVLRQARSLAVRLDDRNAQALLDVWLEQALIGAHRLWNGHWFVSGEQQQVSWAGQVWMVLAGVFEHEDSAALLRRLLNMSGNETIVGMTTPYLVHHLVDALFQYGMRDEALNYLHGYWGHMLAHGADRFFELYNPENMNESPYGGNQVNSFCHAWSCTPSYFIRKYNL